MLPTVFRTFMKENPECSLHVSTLHSSEAYSYVGNRSVDIAFITDPIYSSSVGTHILFKEKLCLVAGKELNLPEHVRIRELDPQLEIRTMWDRNFEAWHSYFFGDKAIPRMYLDEMGFLQYFTQSGDNWAFLPISIARTVLRDAPVSIHTLDVEPPSRTLYYLDRLDDRLTVPGAPFKALQTEAVPGRGDPGGGGIKKKDGAEKNGRPGSWNSSRNGH